MNRPGPYRPEGNGDEHQQYTDVVCGMNLALLSGFTEDLEGAGLEARLDTQPRECCVRLVRQARDDEPA